MVWEEKIREGVLPMRDMAAQKLASGCTLEKWTWPVKWTLSASQTGCSMVWWGSAYIPVSWESMVQFRWQGKELVHRQLFHDLAAWSSRQSWKSTTGMRTAAVRTSRPYPPGHTGSCTRKKRVLGWDDRVASNTLCHNHPPPIGLFSILAGDFHYPSLPPKSLTWRSTILEIVFEIFQNKYRSDRQDRWQTPKSC